MRKFICKICFGILLLITLFGTEKAQTPSPTPIIESFEEEPLEIRTELIQTGVSVFDKKGHFVRDLSAEDFELSVDGKPISLSFFEQITLENKKRSISERKQLGDTKELSALSEAANTPERNIIFVVDDVHLSAANALRVKKLLNKFIEQDVLPNDQIAITTTTGSLGFLQQFSDNKIVWQAAIEKIRVRNYSANDRTPPPMSEYEAYLISLMDSQMIEYFVGLDKSSFDYEMKVESVRSRARTILGMANSFSTITYSALDSVIRRSSALPGRKIVFFISDGFLPDIINSDYVFRMQRITDAAVRANAVIYSLDAKGLEAGFPEEGSTASDMRLGLRVQSGERFDFQSGLSELADRTGGKFVSNNNDLQAGIRKSLEESSNYYLLAWQPDEENGAASVKSSPSLKKIVVKVKNRPELKVRFQNGYLTGNITNKKEKKKSSEDKNEKASAPKAVLSPAEKQINLALNSQVPAKELPVKLLLNYLNVPDNGSVIASVLQIDRNSIAFNKNTGDQSANIDLVGTLYNSDGKRVDSFSKRITVTPSESKTAKVSESKIFFDYQSKVKPGLYQMRIAARDDKSGRIGSDNSWIEIPDENSQPFSLSSLLLFEVFDPKNVKALEQNGLTENGQINIERRFSRSSKMRYMVFAYGATGKNQASLDLTVQTKVRQANKIIMESAWVPIQKEGQDPLRLASASEIPLNGLMPGTYILDVSVQNQLTKKTVLQQVEFEVE